ncbi:MAG: hypothetical protein US58_C0012G0024 [Candidatus Magasanikbacteria bacterium GW2011_GWA2_37_8]|uniref:Glycosyltransferase RgtA/B/C/D-like domain-containing protein n=1 Tax=Candidatus Magasanikbacteria bacterium GW2011_GWA2_37_8 TaxID=1619036 RepID=A0A0G0HQB7_9BACT|nr:MAG: hypothetical protein US58_C0012G0024 [Candidatus Magasanikbacteria bacterium GW2011_GWA2_37_8]
MLRRFVDYLKINKTYFGLLIFFILIIVLVNPIGEFALNDDWFYAVAVRDFGWNFRFDPLITPALIGQILYGTVLIKLFGFSFTILRLSTLVLAVVTMLVLFKLLKIKGWSIGGALLGVGLIFFNPIFFNLSFTFMTDVPALSLVIVSLYYFYQFNQTGKSRFFIFAQLLAFGAGFIRQNYLILPLLSLVLILTNTRKKDFKLWLIYGVSLLAGVLLYYFFQSHGWWPQGAVTMHSFNNGRALLNNALWQGYYLVGYLALFLSPIIIGGFLAVGNRTRLYLAGAGLLGIGLSLVLYFTKHLTFPYFRNIINIYGLGARGANEVLTGTPTITINSSVQLWLTILVGFLVGLAIGFLIKQIIDNRNIKFREIDWVTIFLGLNLLAQIAAIMYLVSFDRYYLAPLVFILLLIPAIKFSRRIVYASGILLFLMAIYAVVGTYNYLAENKIKWAVANTLVAQGALPAEIDAGYEWLGWNTRQLVQKKLPTFTNEKPWYMARIFTDNTRQYVVNYNSVLTGYNLVSSYSYNKFLFGTGSLYLLKKIEL